MCCAPQVSIWYGCVLRADLNTIMVGAFTNIQDRTIIHAARWDACPLTAGPSTEGNTPALSGNKRFNVQHRARATVRAGRRRRACLRTRRSAATALSARRACCGPPTYTTRSSSATAASCWRASLGCSLTHGRAVLPRTPCACIGLHTAGKASTRATAPGQSM